MNRLFLEATDETPGVVLDEAAGVFELSGRALPEDSVEFYTPVLNWLRAYAAQPLKTTDFHFRLQYFNTASSKYIQEMLTILETIKGSTVIWHSFEDDEDMIESGHEFSELVEVPFDFRIEGD